MITAQIVPEDTLWGDESLPDGHPKDLVLLDPDWHAQMLCPCGCGDTLHIMLNEVGSPRWDYALGPNNELTLTPSINRIEGCRSHFFVKNGKVEWCG